MIPAIYNLLTKSLGATYFTRINGKNTYIDTNGRKTERLDRRHYRDEIINCQNGTKLATRGGLWGLAGKAGHFLVQPVHAAMACFSEGVAWVPAVDLQKWCVVYPDGMIDRTRCQEKFFPISKSLALKPGETGYYFPAVLERTRSWLDFAVGLRDFSPFD